MSQNDESQFVCLEDHSSALLESKCWNKWMSVRRTLLDAKRKRYNSQGRSFMILFICIHKMNFVILCMEISCCYLLLDIILNKDLWLALIRVVTVNGGYCSAYYHGLHELRLLTVKIMEQYVKRKSVVFFFNMPLHWIMCIPIGHLQNKKYHTYRASWFRPIGGVAF